MWRNATTAAPIPMSGGRNMTRQNPGLVSAKYTGMNNNDVPKPAAPTMTDDAHPRFAAAICSTPMTLINTTVAVTKPRAMIWVAANNARLGAAAVLAVNMGATVAQVNSKRLRPIRSASWTSNKVMMMSKRIVASARPCAAFDEPKSSTTNEIACVTIDPWYPATAAMTSNDPRSKRCSRERGSGGESMDLRGKLISATIPARRRRVGYLRHGE